MPSPAIISARGPKHAPSRRVLLSSAAAAAVSTVIPARAAEPSTRLIRVDPTPKFELSPHLAMQFMEPLGTTDGSVEASWDHLQNRWRADLVEVTRTLAPPMMRWGGLFSGYYRWREAVGPRESRKPMHNLVWGGVESNQIGTLEFLDFCRQIGGAEPLMCVNFAGEGDPLWVKNALGETRAGDAKEAGAFPLAMTESHFAMRGRNRCDLNSTWAVGVAYARFMNCHQRHGDVLKIANLGDFCGTRWQTNVIMLPTPGGKAYLMPVGHVAALYRKHTGTHFLRSAGGPGDLDVTASRAGDRIVVHVVNTHPTAARTCGIAVAGFAARAGKAFQIAADPWTEVGVAPVSDAANPLAVRMRDLTDPAGPMTFPPASVTAVELTL